MAAPSDAASEHPVMSTTFSWVAMSTPEGISGYKGFVQAWEFSLGPASDEVVKGGRVFAGGLGQGKDDRKV